MSYKGPFQISHTVDAGTEWKWGMRIQQQPRLASCDVGKIWTWSNIRAMLKGHKEVLPMDTIQGCSHSLPTHLFLFSTSYTSCPTTGLSLKAAFPSLGINLEQLKHHTHGKFCFLRPFKNMPIKSLHYPQSSQTTMSFCISQGHVCPCKSPPLAKYLTFLWFMSMQ